MKYVRTSHYVAKSYGNKPSFIIILDDNGVEKPFISNGCQFLELTDDNINKLTCKYNCDSYIKELLDTPIKNDDCITDARSMFQGCTSLRGVNLSLPQAIYCDYILMGCPSLICVNLSLPKAKDCGFFLCGCPSLICVNLSLPQTTDCYYMLHGCTLNKDDINFNWV